MAKGKDQKKEASEKKKANPRNDVKARDAWIKLACSEIDGLIVKDVKVANKEMPTEPVLIYKGKRVCWCAPRAGLLWTNWIFPVTGPKSIIKVRGDAEAKSSLEMIKSICGNIDKLPSKQVKGKKAKKEESIGDVQKRLAKASSGKIHVVQVTPEIEQWVEKCGHHLEGNVISRKIA